MDVELLFKDGKLLARRSYRSILRKGQ